MTSEAENRFKVLLYLVSQAVNEDAACEVLFNFTKVCIDKALTERTEQCAKIVDDETIEGQIGQFMLPEIAAKIRALNQPEKS